MIAVDTNILVYAHRRDSEFHRAAAAEVKALSEGRVSWAIPWPCLHEFFSIVTHPKIYDPPSSTEQAIAQIRAWVASPSPRAAPRRTGLLGHAEPVAQARQGQRAHGA